MCIYLYIYIYTYAYIYIYIHMHNIYIYIYTYNPHLGSINPSVNKVPGPRKLIHHNFEIPGSIISSTQTNNTTWSHLGGDLGGAQKCSGSPGLKKCYV